MWYAQQVFDMEQDEAFDAIRIDGGNDKDIDFFWLDDKNEKIIVAQLKYKQKGDFRPRKGELLSLVHSEDWLRDPNAVKGEGREELINASNDYKSGLNNDYSIEFQYIFLGKATKDVKDQAALLNSNYQSSSPSKYVRVIDLDDLKFIYEENMEQLARVPDDSINLSNSLLFHQKGKFGDALVATVRGSELVSLHNRHGERLFARNVRLFLGMRKGGVNAGINDTINDNLERENFWAYNNGATIICESYEEEYDGEQLRVRLKNFSVVNGCQTVVSLVESDVSDSKKEVELLVRIIAAPEKIVDNIIFFTNSQNPIRKWDLMTQDKVQKRLRKELADGKVPYYYALRKGESKTLSREERRSFVEDGRFRQIKYDQVAQHLASYRGLPYIAYKEKGKIFGAYYDQVFPVDLKVEEVILAWRCAEIAMPIVKSKIEKAKENEDEFESLVFRRGGVIFVVSVISLLVSLRNGANYVQKLKRDVVTSKKTEERIRSYATVGVVLYNRFMRQKVGSEGVIGIAPILRTQMSFKDLKKFVEEEWEMQSINKSWVNSFPMLV